MSKKEPRPSLEPFFAESQKKLDEFCAHIREEKAFAFDTEFVMEDRYKSELCLVQLATSEAVCLVDPQQRVDLSPLWELVCDPGIETVVHAGQEDLGLCVQHTDQVPHRVFDVQIAAGLAGHDFPISLQKLADITLGVRLRKSRTLTDWRRRPLSAEQVNYAAEDVGYLLAVRKSLHRQLSKRKRIPWAKEEFARFERFALYHPSEESRVQRVKGMGALSPKQLAVATEVLEWREEVAQRRNRPARTVLKDHLLVEIARHNLSSPEEIGTLRGVNLSRRDIRSLCDVMQQAAAIPSERWPTRKARHPEAPRETALIALATAVLRSYCLDQSLAYSLCATKKSITDLVRYRLRGAPAEAEVPELLLGWRGETVGAALDEVIAGRSAVSVVCDNGRATLSFTPVKANP